MRAGSRQRRHDVLLIVRDAVENDGEFVQLYLETAVAHPDKLVKNPAPRRANPLSFLVNRAERIACVKIFQRLHVPC